ncbi:MAG TPA: hypothetical protein VLQ45_05595 [Thermoanaerobaculia bacterium]|nr:hypothetical protein [Thermoanaerobaculia bacterium]HSK75910.1 hypothetical protein [Thermoanaerobaculia bacterium]
MKILSYEGDAATLQLKALEIRTLRNVVAELLARPLPRDFEDRLGAEREYVEGLRDSLDALFDQVDPGDL